MTDSGIIEIDKDSVLFGAYGIHYQLDEEIILDDVSFELEKGTLLALIGPNGSGKSTLLKSIAGILSLKQANCSGVVRINGYDFLSHSETERARAVTYVGQDFLPEFPLTAYEAVLLGRSCHPPGKPADEKAIIRKAMEDCLCWEFHRQDLHTLSGGERQLVGLARALAQGSGVLLLDEALSRMDLNHQAAIGQMLKRLTGQGSSIVLVAHDLNLATEWADNALLLSAGRRIATGAVQAVITRENIRKLYPNSPLTVAPSPSSGAPKVFFS